MGSSLTTAAVLQAFCEEIHLQGGNVNDVFDDGARCIARSVLPRIEDVTRGDRLRGGVAMKAHDREIWIYPYVFRLVCSNGAIMAQTLASRQITVFACLDDEDILSDLHQGVRACCDSDVFAVPFSQINATRNATADMALNLMPLLSRISGAHAQQAMGEILRRFFEDGDRTQFGLMNAVTSVARDTADPETRWNLEKLGGAIPALAIRPVPARPPVRGNRKAAFVS
jgi:hypothetical protein